MRSPSGTFQRVASTASAPAIRKSAGEVEVLVALHGLAACGLARRQGHELGPQGSLSDLACDQTGGAPFGGGRPSMAACLSIVSAFLISSGCRSSRRHGKTMIPDRPDEALRQVCTAVMSCLSDLGMA